MIRIGRKICFFEELPSTNSYLKQKAMEGEAEGVVVVAERQSEGKGRMGRTWYSPPGLGLYCSILLRPEFKVDKAALISIAAGIAVGRTIKKVCGIAAQLKWPNDVLINGKKVSGILSESTSTNKNIKFVVVGIGLNTEHKFKDFPPDIRETTTSLAIVTGRRHDKQELLNNILFEFAHLYGYLYYPDNIERLLNEWQSYCCHIGREVILTAAHSKLIGTFGGLAPDGSAIVKDASGDKIAVNSMDFSLRQI